jgi:hypothetical protein
MMKLCNTAFLALALAIFTTGCGVRPGMQGGSKPEVSEVGSVSVVATETPTGKGDTTSFGDPEEPEIEKVDEYTVRPGDSLWKIARKSGVYGSGWLYPLIVKSNKSKIKDPKDLKIGATLRIPRGLSKADFEIAREETMAGTYDSATGYDSVSSTSLSLGGAAHLSPTAKPSPAMVAKKAISPPAKKSGWGRRMARSVPIGVSLAWVLWFLHRRRQAKLDPEPEDK